MRNDRLYDLFAELRRLKTVELPRAEKMKPVSRVIHEITVRRDIRLIEDEIDRRMRDG